MTTEAAPTSLQLSVEQWELLRRLRNSHLSRAQIVRAYDELDRLDRELGTLFNAAEPVSPSSTNVNQKRPHSHAANGFTPRSTSNGHHSHLHPAQPINPSDVEEETRELQELLSKGDSAIHNEISVFVYRYDLKQSQIARMASVNQAYVSKFLRGDLLDLSENGRMAICRWYIRYRKIVQSMGAGGVPSAELLANLATSSEPPTKMPRLSDSQSTNNASPVSFDAPKRTRFTFRPEHLDILEKAFADNPYPDPRRREDLARLCNEARTRADGTSEQLTERDRVTDAIVTHWFQNKRKMAKSQRVSVHDDSLPLSLPGNNSNHPMSALNDFENINSDDDPHVQQSQQKSTSSAFEMDFYDTSATLLDPQMAAYRAIMSRMVPFANNVNGTHSPKRLIKQEPYPNPDESSQGDESNGSSTMNEPLSP